MPRITQSALDALLNTVREGGSGLGTNEVYVLDTLPPDVTVRGDITTAALNGTPKIHAPGGITGTGGLNSPTLTDRRYADGNYSSITLDQNMPATPNFVVITSDAAGNEVLLVADTAGAGQLQAGAVIDLGPWNHIAQTPQ